MAGEAAALKQAREQLTELLEAAKTGALIPIRLPGQIEAILQLVDQAADEHRDELREAQQAAASGDFDVQAEAFFVGHAVHELRTPMTSIRGYTDMMGQMGELNDMQKQFLDVVQTNARRMESLLADVSYVNKVRRKTLKIEPKMDMFKNIAMKVEKAVEGDVEKLGRRFEMNIPSGLPLLNIDGELLALALTKLVENGLRYSAEGEGVVTLSGESDGGDLLIKISDNGIGMSAEEQAQLGEIYFRAENDEVRAHKGSGLGIPIAFGIIQMLGGEITVESTPGSGTTWTIRLPGMQ